jgi:hypothetical protein
MADMVFVAFEERQETFVSFVFMALAAGIGESPATAQLNILPKYAALVKSIGNKGGHIQ